MPTDFLYKTGTNGFLTAPINLFSTELNALASGAAATSSVGGTSGVFSQSSLGSGIWGSLYFTAGGAFTPTAGGYLAGWFLLSTDGGTTFEAAISTPSTSVPALSRAPDFVIPLDNVAHASGNIRWCQGRRILLPAESYKVLIQNNSGVALSASGHTIKCGSVAEQY
jgi:hypothetical protein